MLATTARPIAPRSPSARRPAPSVAAPVSLPTPAPAGYGWHTLMSDGGNSVELELTLPFAGDEDQRANLRLQWRLSPTTVELSPHEHLTGIPVDVLEDFAENLAALIALARKNGLLPPRE